MKNTKSNKTLLSKLQYTIGVLIIIGSTSVWAQVKTQIDSTAIKIGEELLYQIAVKVDTTSLVVFPEGQTFSPLEVIESYPVDTTFKADQLQLIKNYGLTQFDSGRYTIPKQKISVDTSTVFTDSIEIIVNAVKVDTTQQKLYDIKPLIAVKKKRSKWWVWVLIVLGTLGVLAAVFFLWFWKKRIQSNEEKIADLPPYDRAKMALEALDETRYFENKEVKAYYSSLTLILRQYLDEKVYDQSLESTTDELISRLNILKDARKIKLNKETITNIENILRRADLVKFAKSKPDFELARLDKSTIALEIDHVKDSLPEPSEEERLKDLAYKAALEKQRKRKTLIVGASIVFSLLVVSFVGFSIKYGVTTVKDTVLGHPTKALLDEPYWVTSEYGAPGITVTTPVVLEREPSDSATVEPTALKGSSFSYTNSDTFFNIVAKSFSLEKNQPQADQSEENQIDLAEAANQILVGFENEGTTNIFTKNEQFITPNGQEGLKSFGSADFYSNKHEKLIKGNYVILGFSTSDLLQQFVLSWAENDQYADQIVERILASVELIKLTEDNK